jgi:hypothetical protein
MYLISADHLPLSKVVISNCFRCTIANDLSCVLTHSVVRCIPCNALCVKTQQMSWPPGCREKLLITTYQEVNDPHRSNTCCDDEIERVSGNTDLPEQHFYKFKEKYVLYILSPIKSITLRLSQTCLNVMIWSKKSSTLLWQYINSWLLYIILVYRRCWCFVREKHPFLVNIYLEFDSFGRLTFASGINIWWSTILSTSTFKIKFFAQRCLWDSLIRNPTPREKLSIDLFEARWIGEKDRIYILIYDDNVVPVSRRKREWTELDGTAVSRRSVAQVRVNSGDPGRCPKICLKEPGPNGTSAGFQTDENRYYTLILAEKAEKR